MGVYYFKWAYPSIYYIFEKCSLGLTDFDRFGFLVTIQPVKTERNSLMATD